MTRARVFVSTICAALQVALAVPAGATAIDYSWPHYRGPRGDGRSPETGLDFSWSEGEPRELWRFPLGEGYSGISIADGRVFTMFAAGDDEFLVAVDAASGKELWRRRTGDNRRDQFGNGPRSTPTVVGDTVYALGALGKLHALKSASGEPAWSIDLVETYGARVPTWGISTSITHHSGRLLVDAGGREGHSLLALDPKTGELLWHSQTDKPGYSTPSVASIGGEEHALFFTGTALVAVSPSDGKLLWRHPWSTSYDVNAAMPIFLPPDRIFVSSGYDTGSAMLKIQKTESGYKPTELWSNRLMRNHFNSSVLVADHLYGFDNGTLKCIDVATGEQKWAQRGFAKGSLLYADGKLLILSERGVLAAADATPTEYRETGRAQIFNAKTWTMPTLANGILFLRSEKEMVALNLRTKKE